MLVSALVAMVILHSEVGEVLAGYSTLSSARKQSIRALAAFWLRVMIPDRSTCLCGRAPYNLLGSQMAASRGVFTHFNLCLTLDKVYE